MKTMITKIEGVAFHRNGISGAPFSVVTFVIREEGQLRRMVGVVFDEPYHVAVFDRDLIGQGDIRFGHNSWRGDRYEDDLRHSIARWSAKRERELMQPSKTRRRRPKKVRPK